MAEFSNMAITTAGREMIAQAQLGDKMIFTKIQLGDGTLASGTDLDNMPALISNKLDLPIFKAVQTGTDATQIMVEGIIDPAQIVTSFWLREIGLWAKVGETGQERLYCYSNAGTLADYLSAVNIGNDYKFDLYVIVGNTANVQLTLAGGLYVTKDELKEHNTSDDAHANLFAEKLNKVGDTADGLLTYAASIMNDLTNQIPATDSTGKLSPTKWVQNLLAAYKVTGANDVIWSGNNFSCPKLDIRGLMEQNGYVVFGCAGGLCIQWGNYLSIGIDK